MLLDPFNRTRLPQGFDRAGRVALLAEVFEALVEGRQPSREAALFVGGGGLAWLQEGGTVGDLERDYWRVAAPRRSTMTPARLWAASTRRATQGEEVGTMDASSTSESDP